MSDEAPEEEPFESPPEGASCAEHSERAAIAVCPRCGAHACVACWHHPIRRCHACLMRDPAAAAPPIPWENPAVRGPARFFSTLASAASPEASAPAFGRGGARDALGFALLSYVPLALLSHEVEFTHTLLFSGGGNVTVIGGAAPEAIALDVAQAAGLGLLVSLAMTLALGISYRSLAIAFSSKGHPAAPARVMLYRAWLLPLSFVVAQLAALLVPEPTVAAIGQAIPLVLLFSSLRATARMGSGTGPFAALLVVLVPFFLMLIVGGMVQRALAPILPDPAAIEAAARAAGAIPP